MALKTNLKEFLHTSLGHDALLKYFRLEVFGLNNIPRGEKLIFISNHSGFMGLDALVLRSVLIKRARISPKILLHKFWYSSKASSYLADSMDFIEARYPSALESLKKQESLIIFPEGAHGNFKPFTERYVLQEFKSGFLRLAIDAKATIVPVVILGPEDSNINLKKIDLSRFFRNSALPVPLNVVPLPAKWRIHFLNPLSIPDEVHSDPKQLRQISCKVRNALQAATDERRTKRGHPFF